MRNEPKEIKLTLTANNPRSRRGGRPGAQIAPAPMAIDEAFANLNDGSLGDGEKQTAQHQNAVQQQQALIATLVSQLETLDRQRQQLASLLDGIQS